MAIISSRDCHVIAGIVLCLTVVGCVTGKPLPQGPDTFRGTNIGIHIRGDPSEKIFNVMSFGAKADGRKDNTQAFMQTWVNACRFRGKARVVIPPGTYKLGPVTFAGPCLGPPPIVVQVSGTLLGDTDISLYDEPQWFLFENLNGVVVIGSGIFDGQGESSWKYNDCKNNNDCIQLPSNIKINKVINGVFRGFSSVDSKGVHIFITQSQNIRLRNLHLLAPADSPNTDGIHISTSNNVRITKSIIATGDDCIGLIKGSTNIAINKVTCGPGHGVSIGSLGKYENEEDVYGIIVKNSTFLRTDNGLRIKTWPGSTPSKATGILFQDIIMDNVRNPILIDQGYCPSGCKKEPSRVKISNVYFINVRGTSSSPVAVNFLCSPQYPCDQIHLFNIDLKSTARVPATAMCVNARLGRTGGVQNPRVSCR